MLLNYAIPLLITFLLAAFCILLLRVIPGSTGARVEMIITGDEKAENMEKAVIIAKRLAQRYFKNAEVYVRGGANTYIDALCRRYDVRRKE